MATAAAVQQGADRGDIVVALDEVEFAWSTKDPAILALDRLHVVRGEQLFIAGPSGSGKSTLLSLLAGVNVAQRGSVRVLGTPLEGLGDAARDRFRADHIGYIFQMFNLIPYLSVIDNVILPCRFSRRRQATAVARSGGLREEALRLLGDLDMADRSLLERPVTQLSVGQQQRVAAARALMGAPELLIADEPTSSLDADRREAFVRLLFEECRSSGSTLIFVSHDPALRDLFGRRIDLPTVNRVHHPAADA